MTGTDLLTPLVDGRRPGQVVLPTGGTRAGWRGYGGSRMGMLVADEDRQSEGDPQNGRVVHVRTAPNGSGGAPGAPEYLRVHTVRHHLFPTVHCSFRIEGLLEGDDRAENFAVRIMLCHQDNLTAYHASLLLNGRTAIVKEGRDAYDPSTNGIPARNLGVGSWDPRTGARQPVRHHVRAGVEPDGRVWMQVDDNPTLEVVDDHPVPSGQVGFRLDGVDATLHSLMLTGPMAPYVPRKPAVVVQEPPQGAS